MIVINARFLTQQITGVQRYAIEICEHLPKYIKEQEVILVAPKGDLLNEKKINNHRIVKFGKLKGQLWEQIDLLHFLKNNNNPILINFGGIGPIWYNNKISYIHDLAFKYFPENFTYFFQKAYNIFVPISAKNSDRCTFEIITPRDKTKRGAQLSILAHGQGKGLFDAQHYL